jgi:hypothetical protein
MRFVIRLVLCERREGGLNSAEWKAFRLNLGDD